MILNQKVLNKLLNKKALKISIGFFIIYWPIVIVGAMYGHGMAWGGGPKNVVEKGSMFFLKFFYLIPSIGLFNSLLSTLIVYLIALGIILVLKEKKPGEI